MQELNLIKAHPYKNLLRYHGITQRALASNLHISQPTLNGYLLGYRDMPNHIEQEIGELLASISCASNYQEKEKTEHQIMYVKNKSN